MFSFSRLFLARQSLSADCYILFSAWSLMTPVEIASPSCFKLLVTRNDLADLFWPTYAAIVWDLVVLLACRQIY